MSSRNSHTLGSNQEELPLEKDLREGPLFERYSPEVCREAVQLLFEGEIPGASARNLSRSTRYAYRSAWRDFARWQDERRAGALPASGAEVARFLVDRAELSRSALKKRRSAVRFVHRGLGLPDPTARPEVTLVWKVLGRDRKKPPGGDQTGNPSHTSEESGPSPEEVQTRSLIRLRERANEGWPGQTREEESSEREPPDSPLTEGALKHVPLEDWGPEDLTEGQRKIVPEPSGNLKTLRDRALLLLGATAKLRRRELVGVRAEDVRIGPEPTNGLLVGVRRGKKHLDRVLKLRAAEEPRFDAPGAVAAWLLEAELQAGPLARSLTPQGKPREEGISPQGLNQMIKQRARDAGLEPGNWSARTLRERPDLK